MVRCNEIQKRLADQGTPAVAAEAKVRAHIESCENCARFFKSLKKIENALTSLPQHEPPADLLDRVKRSIERDPLRPSFMQRRWATGIASVAVVLAAVGIGSKVFYSFDLEQVLIAPAKRPAGKVADLAANSKPNPEVQRGQYFDSKNQEHVDYFGGDSRMVEFGQVEGEGKTLSDIGGLRDRAATKHRPGDDSMELYRRELSRSNEAELQSTTEKGGPIITGELVARLTGAEESRFYSMPEEFDALRERQGGREITQQSLSNSADMRSDVATPIVIGDEVHNFAELDVEHASNNDANQSSSEVALLSPETSNYPLSRLAQKVDEPAIAGQSKAESADVGAANKSTAKGKRAADEMFAVGTVGSKNETAEINPKDKLPHASVAADLDDVGADINPTFATKTVPDRARRAARNFLAQLESTEELKFQDATGYWANTYVPGDNTLRMLEARLAAWDRSVLSGGEFALERAAHTIAQPFDMPEGAAIAVYMDADKRGIDGPTRMRLQVGLQGALRQSSHRPPMNVALVLDLGDELTNDESAALRALVAALEQSKQVGDRFALVVAGKSGGVVVPPEEFRHGPLRLTLTRLLINSQTTAADGMSVEQAVTAAAETIRSSDDQDAGLETNLVLLATTHTANDDLAELERIAHQSAVNGVMLSVVGVGDRISPTHLDRLVLAGQGNRRILHQSDEALKLIGRELHAASASIARAIRLRIRLAPGVRLVNVVGSRRLDDSQVRRVRQAEHGIDQRLAREMGIQVDRGADEEGIQIVIPSFQSGDTHVILLDVVADELGPVADVTVRYKDLVHLRNSVARARLSLPGDHRAPGPLQRNVLKNLLAWKVSDSVWRASQHLTDGNRDQAATVLSEAYELLRGLRAELTGWDADIDLINDERMIAEYVEVLALPVLDSPEQRLYLANSLHYAALRKLLPAP
ncbi:MAG: hypothetical protein OEU36_04460 [Gammaproteobacteria bacterium]|nr:hypothetical protein [Gammaproteobacteria bacterium]